MSIASEILRLKEAKASIKKSIENKGITVDDDVTLDEYATLIDAINGEGEGGENQPIEPPFEPDSNLTYLSFEGQNIKAENTIEGYAKSAILKGQTLVNLIDYNNATISTTSKYVQFQSMLRRIVGETITVINNSDKTIRTQTTENESGAFKRQINLEANTKKLIILEAGERFTRLRGTQSDGWTVDESGLNELKTTTMVIEGDYTNIDIPYFEGMGAVKMPVLTTSNEDGTKTNILTCNEDVTLRSNGNICDELNLLTGQLTQRIDEDGEVLSQEVVKTVDLSSNTVYAYNGTTHYTCSSEEGSLIPIACIEVPVETETVE